jgi:hypothetical protein
MGQQRKFGNLHVVAHRYIVVVIIVAVKKTKKLVIDNLLDANLQVANKTCRL